MVWEADGLNQLERDTYVMKLMLVLMRDRRARQGQVRSVGYTREYGELPDELGVGTLAQLSNEELLALAEQIGIKNRPAAGKSDIYMNDLGYMLLSTKQSLAIVDNLGLQELAKLAEQVGTIELVEPIKGLIVYGQAQAGDEPLKGRVTDYSQFTTYRDQWHKLLTHMLCNGAATCLFPAELVLRYADPTNMNSWDIYEPNDFISKNWEDLSATLSGLNGDYSITIQLQAGE